MSLIDLRLSAVAVSVQFVTVRYKGWLADVLLVSVMTAAPMSCGFPAASDNKLCELGFLPTQPTVTGPNVLGTMWAKCAPDRPATHHLVLSLEWRVRGSNWSASSQEVSDTVPGASRTSYQVKAPCVAGIWRIKAEVAATFQGRSFNVTETSQERLVGADACRPG